MTLNDWDISLHLLRELYLKPELSVPPPSRPGLPRSGSSNIIGTWSGSSPVGSHAPTLPLGVLHGSAAPTPQTPPSIMRPRTRADSSASIVSQSQSIAGSEMGNGGAAAGLRRSPSMSHAATPRHATASRKRTAAASKSGSNADIFLPPTGSNGSSPRNAAAGPSSGLAIGNSSLRPSGSLASLSSIATGSVANDRSRVISYSAQSTANYLPTRVLSFEQKKRILVTGG